MSDGNGKALATVAPATGALVESVVAQGDLHALTPEARVVYYRQVCDSLGLNWLTQPLGYITLNGKLVLYALKGATDQLRSVRQVSITRVEHEIQGDIYVATAHARLPDGREDSDMGAVSIAGLRGEGLANGYMKAITKAKRRVTLSICGLGWLDESEVETVPGAQPATVDRETGELAPPVGRLEPTSKPPLCDARRWQSRWFATVSGTRFASTVERHEFVRSISRDVTSSLGEYLAQATEDQAAALIAALEEAIADDKQARAIPTKSEQVGNNACWICGVAVADEKGWAARCRERTRSTAHREGVLLCVPHATEWNAMLTADKAEPHTKAADGFLAELVRVWATEHREQDEPEEAEA